MKPVVHVACLCAAWCRVCDGYAAVFDAVAAEFEADGVELRRHWIDIEDEADLVGDIDVQTFPMLVIADAHAVRFAGAVTPQPDILKRLLRSTVGPDSAAACWPEADPAAAAFAARLRERAP